MSVGNTEMEIKLLIDKKYWDKLEKLPIIKEYLLSGTSKTVELDNFYYDTVDYKLSNAGIAYRIRRTGKKYEATVKTQASSVGGFSERMEYTIPVSKQRPVIRGFQDEHLDNKLSTLLTDDELQVLFEIKITRRLCQLQITPQTTLELAIDEGEIISDKKREKVEEVELEILAGNKAELWEYVARLAEQVPLFVEPRSKFRRGLNLLSGSARDELETLKTPDDINKNGNVEVEIKKLMTFYADSILGSVKELRDKDNLQDADRILLRKLKQLRAIVNFVYPLLDARNYKYYREIIIEIVAPLQELYVLKRFLRQWKRIYQKSGTLLYKNVLLERLQERQAEIVTKIEAQVESGLYGRAMFKLLADVEKTHWQGAEFLQLQQFALHRLKDWHDALLKIAVVNGELSEGMARKMRRIVESMVLVRRDIKIGRLDKDTFTYLKALYRNLKVLNFDIYGHKDILAFLQGSNSRLLYRDAGLLIGYRLGEMPQAWRKVQKSWRRLLDALKKK